MFDLFMRYSPFHSVPSSYQGCSHHRVVPASFAAPNTQSHPTKQSYWLHATSSPPDCFFLPDNKTNQFLICLLYAFDRTNSSCVWCNKRHPHIIVLITILFDMLREDVFCSGFFFQILVLSFLFSFFALSRLCWKLLSLLQYIVNINRYCRDCTVLHKLVCLLSWDVFCFYNGWAFYSKFNTSVRLL